MPTAPAVDRSTAPSATASTADERAVPDLQPDRAAARPGRRASAARHLGQRDAARAHTDRQDGGEQRAADRDDERLGQQDRVRRGATVNETCAMPDANSVVPASTPSTSSDEMPDPESGQRGRPRRRRTAAPCR